MVPAGFENGIVVHRNIFTVKLQPLHASPEGPAVPALRVDPCWNEGSGDQRDRLAVRRRDLALQL
jgi:hypothetical protein